MSDIVPACNRLPFDAEKAKDGAPVCLANGERVYDFHWRYNCRRYPFAGRLGPGRSWATWTYDGYAYSDRPNYEWNLRMIRQPEKETAVPDATPTRYDLALCEPFDEARARKGDAVCDEYGEPTLVLHYSENEVVACLFERLQNLEWRHQRNLRMAPRKTKRWWFQVWRHPDGTPKNNGVFYATREEALKAQNENSTIAFTDIPE